MIGLSRRGLLAAAPVAAVLWGSPALAATSAPLAVRSRKLFVEATVNEHATLALLDTGASTSAISMAFATQLGVQVYRGVGSTMTGQRMEILRVAGLQVDIAGETLAGMTAMVADLAPLSMMVGRQVGALIGRDLFDRYVVDLDLDAGRMTLTKPGDFDAAALGPAIPLEPMGSLLGMPVRIGGGAPTLAMLDLGADEGLMVSPSVAERLELLDGVKVSEMVGTGAGGMTVAKVATLKDVAVGGRSFAAVPVTFPSSMRDPMIVGGGILSRFNLTLDFAGRRLWMRPNRDIDAPFRKDVLGLAVGRDRRIVHVPSGSPAEAAGVKPGDVLVGFEDRASYAELSGPAPPIGKTLVVLFADGVKRTLTSAEYY